MGLLYESKSVEKQTCIGFICDRCEKRYVDDLLETQEMLHKRDTGGYGSVFGDGDTWEVTLCQHCVAAVLGMFIQYINP